MLYVGVIGPGAGAEASEELLEVAEEVGRGLAAAGAVVLCGGLGGVMEAAGRGAQEAGGTCVGLLPGEHRREGNPFLSIALPTGLGEARNAIIVTASDVLIAIGKGYGTLSEIALALRAHKRVIALQTWAIGEPDPRLVPVGSATEAVRRALERV